MQVYLRKMFTFRPKKYTNRIMKHCRTLFLLLFFGLSFSLFAQKEKESLNFFLQSESLKQAGVGLKVWDLNENKIILSHNEQISFIPASCMKLISTAATLELLGRDYQFKTPLLYTGIITPEGVLNGDLILEGRNDPSFGSQFTGTTKEQISRSILNSLKEAGIKSINGRIIVDDLSYRKEPLFSPKWLWEDLGNYYAPAVYGISFMDNAYELSLRSGNKNDSVKIAGVRPSLAGISFENHIQVTNVQNNNVFINGIPYSNERILSGTIKENQTGYRIKGEIPDPASFLANWISDLLKENQIPVSGTPTTTRLSRIPSSERKLLFSFVSPTLPELIKLINYRSNNHYAEYLSATFERESGKSMEEFWKAIGINTAGQFMYDGSGLSPANALSACFLTDVLIHMYKRSSYSQTFYQSLPLAGMEGSVGSFLKGSVLEGNARIKSGSMSNVQTYAGYISYKGKNYAFALFINNYTESRASLRKQIESLLCGLF